MTPSRIHKTKRLVVVPSFLAVLIIMTTVPAHGATRTWVNGDGFWTFLENWVEGAEPTLEDDVFIDSLQDGTGGRIRLNGGAAGLPIRSVKSITFTAGIGEYLVEGITGGDQKDFVIGSGGVVNESSVTQEIDAQILLAAPQTWSATAGNIVAQDIVQLDSNTLTLDGPQDITINGTISGTGGLIKNGAGTLVLGAPSEYSGSTVLNSGTLLYATAQTLTGPLVLNGGILDANDQVLSFGALALGGDSTVRFGVDGTSQSLTFSSGSWSSGSLTIENWSEAAGSDQLIISAEPSQDLLNRIEFSGYAPGALWSDGVIYPIPEPSTWVLTGLGLLAVLADYRRRSLNK